MDQGSNRKSHFSDALRVFMSFYELDLESVTRLLGVPEHVLTSCLASRTTLPAMAAVTIMENYRAKLFRTHPQALRLVNAIRQDLEAIDAEGAG